MNEDISSPPEIKIGKNGLEAMGEGHKAGLEAMGEGPKAGLEALGESHKAGLEALGETLGEKHKEGLEGLGDEVKIFGVSLGLSILGLGLLYTRRWPRYVFVKTVNRILCF